MSEWLDLILGDGEGGGVTKVQQPIGRPAPIPRPGSEMPSRAMPQAAQPPMAREAAPSAGIMSPKDAQNLIFGDEPKAPQMTAPNAAAQAAPDVPFEGYQDPKIESWAQKIYRDVAGRKDPRFANLKALDQEMEAEGNKPFMRTMTASLPFATTEEQQRDIAKNSLGPRYIGERKDAYGATIIDYKGHDGSQKSAYLNTPGLDSLDVSRALMQAAPYALTGGVAGIGAKGIGGRVIRQFGAGAATSLANDVAAMGAGAEQAPDPVRAGIVGGIAGGVQLAAPAAGYFWRKWVTEPSLYRNGALTPKGEAAAVSAGIDPAIITQDLAQQFAAETARTGSARMGKTILGKQFDIETTRGQLFKDPGQLLTEKAMRTGNYGDPAKTIMQDFDKRQAQQIANAALGDGSSKLSVAAKLNPNRVAQSTGPADIGSEIMAGAQEARSAAKGIESQTWGQVKGLMATDAAKAELPSVISGKIGPLRVDDKLTPKAFAMAEDLDNFIAGGTPSAGPKVLGQAPVQDVGDMRKRLLATYRGAQDPQDKSAAKAIYDGFNEWIDTSAQKALLNGDPASAAWMRQARDVTKEMQSIFGPTAAGGGRTPGRNIVQDLLKEGTTPETIVTRLFSTDPGASPKAGTVEALNLIKQGMDKYLPPIRAQAVWNDIRLGAWQKLVQKPDGSLHTPTMITQNIDKFLRSQESVARVLYKPDDIRLIRQFGAAMKEIAYKDPNPSGSGTAAAFYAGQWGQAIMRMLMNPQGPLFRVLNGIMQWSGVKNATGTMAAQRALNVKPPTVNPNFGPYGAVAGSKVDAELDPDTIRNWLQ